MEHSWETASSDVKRLILERTDPAPAQSLCQINPSARRFCRDRLLVEQKYRICLKGEEDAKRCDQIPMFSKRQFISLIPEKIKIFPNDAVQLTHEFFSQTYKLPNEGYAMALRKAKLMNTICALARPEFLLSEEAKTLRLPAYVDTTILDAMMRKYLEKLPEFDAWLYFGFTFNKPDSTSPLTIMLDYDASIGEIKDGPNQANVSMEFMDDARQFDDLFLNDEFIPAKIKRHLAWTQDEVFDIMIDGKLNIFYLSRLIKTVFDMGYYQVDFDLKDFINDKVLLTVAL